VPGWLDEAKRIIEVLTDKCGKTWDGKAAILALRRADYQWRQMEWIGWYFEYMGRKYLLESLGGAEGPKFGNTRFDYMLRRVWDLKAHPTNGSNRWMILNDKEAIEECLKRHRGVGFVVAVGTARFDLDGSFKAWHDGLKGGISEYEIERVRRNAPSRKRKISFSVAHYVAFFWDSLEVIETGRRGGWVSTFQEGMRNADGSPRRAKYSVRVDSIPDAIRIDQG
jgi:hypothetical protein